MFSVYICDNCRFSLRSLTLFVIVLSVTQYLIFVTIIFFIFIVLPLVCQYSASCIYSHDNSYLSMEYNNWVPLIDPTVSINTSWKRKYRKRYIDNFNLQKNSHYMREANKLILAIIYRILPQMLILMPYDYYRRMS